MKIRFQLLTAFGAIVIIWGLGAAQVFVGLAGTRRNDERAVREFKVVETVTVLERAARRIEAGAYLFVIKDPPMGRQLVKEGSANVKRALAQLKSQITDRVARAELDEIEPIALAVLASGNAVVRRTDAANATAGTDRLRQMRSFAFLQARVAAINLRLEILADRAHSEVATTLRLGKRITDWTRAATLWALGIALLLALLLSSLMARRITTPVERMTKIADRVSRGDLAVEVKVGGGGEIALLGESFQRMVNAFKIMEAMNDDAPPPAAVVPDSDESES